LALRRTRLGALTLAGAPLAAATPTTRRATRSGGPAALTTAALTSALTAAATLAVAGPGLSCVGHEGSGYLGPEPSRGPSVPASTRS
jgi:hypothetical protein